jgi:hypothetical protein
LIPEKNKPEGGMQERTATEKGAKIDENSCQRNGFSGSKPDQAGKS